MSIGLLAYKPVERDLSFAPTSCGECARFCGSKDSKYPGSSAFFGEYRTVTPIVNDLAGNTAEEEFLAS